MKHLRKWYFPIICIVATSIYLSQFHEISIPELINNYLNDLLCMPIVLKICQYSVRIIKSNKNLILPVSLQLVVTLMFCIYFEYILPSYNIRYTSDWLDIIAYFIGLMIFLAIEQPHFFKHLSIFTRLKNLEQTK